MSAGGPVGTAPDAGPGSKPTLRQRYERLPLRVRLVAGFLVVMAVVLGAAGAFVYGRVYVDFDDQLDRDLADKQATLEPIVGPDGRVPVANGPTSQPSFGEYQTLSAANTVVSAGTGVFAASLLDADELAAARRGPIHVQVGALLPGSPHPLRLLATPLVDRGPAVVMVVGVRRDQRDESLRELLATLALAGGAALVVAAVVGERLAKAALAPVERYRTQAATIAAGATGVRLDVPPARDDEVTRLGHTFNDVLAALERAVERERRFVDDASHELRTPLTLLTTRVQLLRRRPRSTAEYEVALAELETDIRDLVSLSEQLLELGAATEADHAEPTEPVDVTAVVADMRLGDLGVEVVVGDAPVPVSATAAQIRRIVTNLVANARTHGDPPVELTVERREGMAVVTVHDAGGGIDAELLPLLTERFRRGDSARAASGTGLGLALVASLVQRHRGELWICSAGRHHHAVTHRPFPCQHRPTGTTVTMALPASDASRT